MEIEIYEQKILGNNCIFTNDGNLQIKMSKLNEFFTYINEKVNHFKEKNKNFTSYSQNTECLVNLISETNWNISFGISREGMQSVDQSATIQIKAFYIDSNGETNGEVDFTDEGNPTNGNMSNINIYGLVEGNYVYIGNWKRQIDSGFFGSTRYATMEFYYEDFIRGLHMLFVDND